MSGKREARAVTAVVAVLAASTFVIPHFPTAEAVVTWIAAAAFGAGFLYFAFIVIRDLWS